jgi:hypothetical protein
MSTKTFHGSCHCGRVTFEADIDLSQGTGKCNCSICWKVRNWSTNVKPDAFRLLTGEDSLGDYQFNTKQGHHQFCKHCGVQVFGHGDIPEIGGAYVSIKLAALDDLDPAELVAAPVKLFDGRNNAWWNVPAETRHL